MSPCYGLTLALQVAEMMTEELEKQDLKLVTIEEEKEEQSQALPRAVWGVTESDIEKYSRIIFPLLFFIFQFLYWTTLFRVSELFIEDLIPLHNNI